MQLNGKETAMILAGLRLLQQEMVDGGTKYLPLRILAILDDADVGEGAIADIDRLCEDKINVKEGESGGQMPFKTPITIESERFLVAADQELIVETFSAAPGELEAIVTAVNGHDRLLDSLADVRECLANWVDIQSKGDEREEDDEALDKSAALLREFGRAVG